MDKSIRKSGGGAHNWGSPLDQYDDSELYDEGFDEEELTVATATANVQAAAEDAASSPKDRRRSSVSASSTEEHATVNNEEKEKALAFRKRALSKGDSESSIPSFFLFISHSAFRARFAANLIRHLADRCNTDRRSLSPQSTSPPSHALHLLLPLPSNHRNRMGKPFASRCWS